MLTIKGKGLLLNIIKHCDKILQKINGIEKYSFYENEDIIEIICFNIMQIGELAKHFSNDFTAKNNEVPWKQIKGMRDMVAHDYGTVDIDIVWGTATKDIKELRKYCDKILQENL